MEYEAMARRYRPTTFADVIGQEPVARTLQNALAANRVAHAYLFCGAHGCGKTTMARIFAGALVCEHGVSPNPCGKCALCLSAMRGGSQDVLEIDGASNNGVDQVRELRENANYLPTVARYKIYIIDEVHMLSDAAFNALLKTLEEPPAHVKFILATTDPQELPRTILSRCQRFDFRLVPPEKMIAFFRSLAGQEKAEITDDALAAIAAFSGGSVRDGLVLLDQLFSFGNGTVSREDVEQARGAAGAETLAQIMTAIVDHDLPEVLRLIDQIAQQGANVADFLDQLIAFGRDLLQMVANRNYQPVNIYGPARAAAIKIAPQLKLEQTLLILDVFCEARTRIKQKALPNPLVPLEMAAARLAGIDNLMPLDDLIAQITASTPEVSRADLKAPPKKTPTENASPKTIVAETIEKKNTETVANNSADNSTASTENGGEKKNTEAVIASVDNRADEKISPTETTETTETLNSVSANSEPTNDATEENSTDDEAPNDLPETKIAGADSANNTDKLDGAELWEAIKNEAKKEHRQDAAYFRGVNFARQDGQKIFVSCGALAKEQLDSPERLGRLKAAAKNLTGHDYEFDFSLRKRTDKNESAPTRDSSTKTATETSPEIALLLKTFAGKICGFS